MLVLASDTKRPRQFTRNKALLSEEKITTLFLDRFQFSKSSKAINGFHPVRIRFYRPVIIRRPLLYLRNLPGTYDTRNT